MEETANNNAPQDDTRKQTAEDLAHLLDSIDTEVADMAAPVLPKESRKENAPYSDDDETAELDPEPFFEGEDLQLDIETAGDSAKLSTEIQSKEQDAKSEIDILVDDKDEGKKVPVEKEKLNTDTEEGETTGEENATASILSDKISEFVDRSVEEKISAIAQQPYKKLSGGGELKSGGEGQEEVGSQKSEGSLLHDELTATMNSRIEKIVIRTLEERMPAMIEQSIFDALKNILLSM
jgi:hypothetical protein